MTIKQLLELAGVAHLPKAKLLIEQEQNTKFEYERARQEFEKQADPEDVRRALAEYRRLVADGKIGGSSSDIMYWARLGTFRSWKMFNRFVWNEDLQKLSLEKKPDRPGKAIVLQDTPDWLIVVPLDKTASCYYGSNTEWCSDDPYSGDFDEYMHNRDYVFVYFMQVGTGNKWTMIASSTDHDDVMLFDKNNQEIDSNTFKQQTGIDPSTYHNYAVKQPRNTRRYQMAKDAYRRANM